MSGAKRRNDAAARCRPLGHRLGSVTSQIGAIPEKLIREFLKGSTALKVLEACAPKPSIQQVSSVFLYNPLYTQW